MALSDLFKRKPKVEKRDAATTTADVRLISTAPNRFKEVSNPAASMKNSIVYRSLSILADSVASIPLYIYRKDSHDHWVIDQNNDLYDILTRRSNERQNPYELLENTVMQLYLYGNAFIYIKRSGQYDVSQLVLIQPGNCTFDQIRNVYIVSDPYNKVFGTFTPDRMIHIKSKSLTGLTGLSPLNFAGTSIGLAQAVDAETGKTIANGGKFKGLISSESSLVGFNAASDAQVDVIAENLAEQINEGRDIMTLNSGADWKPMSQTNRDMEVVDVKVMSLSDIARFFGISAAKLGISTSSNYKASDQEQVNFFVDTLQPLLKKIEKAFNEKLISKSISKKYSIHFDVKVLPYYTEIIKAYKQMNELGLMSINDIAKELYLPYVDNGDTHFVSCNIQSIEDRIEATAEQNAPNQSVQEPEEKPAAGENTEPKDSDKVDTPETPKEENEK